MPIHQLDAHLNEFRMIQIKIVDFEYPLPGDRIARYPLQDRGQSKLLIYSGGNISHTVFKNISDFLPADQLMVFNNTRVIQARLKFVKSSGALIEIFCLEPAEPADYETAFSKTGYCTWKCLVGNARKWKHGVLTLNINNENGTTLPAGVTGRESGAFLIRFSWVPAYHPF